MGLNNLLRGFGEGAVKGYEMAGEAERRRRAEEEHQYIQKQRAEEAALKTSLAEAAGLQATERTLNEPENSSVEQAAAAELQARGLKSGQAGWADMAGTQAYKNYVPQKQWEAGGQTFDAKPTDAQMEGLRASRIAQAYQTAGKPMEAIAFENASTQRHINNANLSEKRREQSVMEEIKRNEKEFNDDNTIMGASFPGMDVSHDVGKDGKVKVTVWNRVGKDDKPSVAQERTFDSVEKYTAFVDGERNKAQLAMMATISPEHYFKAKQAGVSDKQIQLLADKAAEDKRQFDKTYDQKDRHHTEDAGLKRAMITESREDRKERRLERTEEKKNAAIAEALQRADKELVSFAENSTTANKSGKQDKAMSGRLTEYLNYSSVPGPDGKPVSLRKLLAANPEEGRKQLAVAEASFLAHKALEDSKKSGGFMGMFQNPAQRMPASTVTDYDAATGNLKFSNGETLHESQLPKEDSDFIKAALANQIAAGTGRKSQSDALLKTRQTESESETRRLSAMMGGPEINGGNVGKQVGEVMGKGLSAAKRHFAENESRNFDLLVKAYKRDNYLSQKQMLIDMAKNNPVFKAKLETEFGGTK